MLYVLSSSIFLSAVWLPHSQLWTTVEGTAYHWLILILTQRSPDVFRMKVFCSCCLRGMTSHPRHPSPWTCHWTPQDFCAGLLTSGLRFSEIKTNKFFYSDDISIVWHPLHKGRGWDFSKTAVMGSIDPPVKFLCLPPFFQILSTPLLSLPCYLQPPPPLFFLFFCGPVSLAEWLITSHSMCYFT